MTIWKLSVNEEYNNAFLIDENGDRIYEKGAYFKSIQKSPHSRNIRIEEKKKGFPDIMNYWVTCGTCIVSKKAKTVIEKNFGDLSIQFFPCCCKQYPDVEMWILNVCEYHDVLDLNNASYVTGKNFNNEDVIMSIKKWAFSKEAFSLDMFKIILNNKKDYIYLFVSDRFKTVMEENGVTGLALEKVYSI